MSLPGRRKYTRNIQCIEYTSIYAYVQTSKSYSGQMFHAHCLKNILFHWSTQLTDRNKPYKSKFHTNKSITFSTVWLYFFQKVRENELMQFLARHLGACNQAQTSHRLKGPLMFGTTALRYPPKFSTVSLLVYIWLYWL